MLFHCKCETKQQQRDRQRPNCIRMDDLAIISVEPLIKHGRDPKLVSMCDSEALGLSITTWEAGLHRHVQTWPSG